MFAMLVEINIKEGKEDKIISIINYNCKSYIKWLLIFFILLRKY